MSKLFAAFPLPDIVADHLAGHLAALPAFPDEARTEPRVKWHITVAFYKQPLAEPGVDDAQARLRWLTERARNHPAPRLRLRGAGHFPGVAWIGVHGDPRELGGLAESVAAENEYRAYVPHVTIARGPREWTPDLPDYEGPEWIAPELVLYSSEQGRYTPTGVVRLALSPTC